MGINYVKKTYDISPITSKRIEILLNLGHYVTEIELVRRALNIGLDQIEKEIDIEKKE